MKNKGEMRKDFPNHWTIGFTLVCPQSVADFNTKCPHSLPKFLCVWEHDICWKFLAPQYKFFPVARFSQRSQLLNTDLGLLDLSTNLSFTFCIWRGHERFVTTYACHVSSASEYSLKPFPHRWCKEPLPRWVFTWLLRDEWSLKAFAQTRHS